MELSQTTSADAVPSSVFIRAIRGSLLLACVFISFAAQNRSLAAGNAASDGWVTLFDGTSMEGWKANENPQTWSIQEGVLVAKGPVSHLFYVGPTGDAQFADFELEVEARTAPNTNSGVFFRQPWQETGWLQRGMEAQLQNSGKNSCYTGGLWQHADFVGPSPVADGEWFQLHITAIGGKITVRVNGKVVTEYDEERETRAFLKNRRKGFLALQGHGPQHRPEFRKVRIRQL